VSSDELEPMNTSTTSVETVLLQALAYALEQAVKAIPLEDVAREIARLLEGHRKLTASEARALEADAEAAHVKKFGPRT